MHRNHYEVHLATLLNHLGVKGEIVLRGYVEGDNPWLHIHTLAIDEGDNPVLAKEFLDADYGQYVDSVDLLRRVVV